MLHCIGSELAPVVFRASGGAAWGGVRVVNGTAAFVRTVFVGGGGDRARAWGHSDSQPVLFAEVARVLRPGGRFGIYDVMRVADGDITFPVPWASDPAMSFVASPASYRKALGHAGFRVVDEHDNSALALDFFDALRARATEGGGPPPLGLHLVMGAAAPTKITNMVDAVRAGTLAPVEIVAVREDGSC